MFHLPRGRGSPHSTGRCFPRTPFLGKLGYERAREVGLRPDCLRFDRVSLGLRVILPRGCSPSRAAFRRKHQAITNPKANPANTASNTVSVTAMATGSSSCHSDNHIRMPHAVPSRTPKRSPLIARACGNLGRRGDVQAEHPKQPEKWRCGRVGAYSLLAQLFDEAIDLLPMVHVHESLLVSCVLAVSKD